MGSLKLTIELVPSSSWQNNLRSILKPKMWKELRDKVCKTSNDRCSICKRGGVIHAHEVWEYEDANHIQKLKDIIPLCYLCHSVKHIGFATLKGETSTNEKLIKHFMKVNNCDRIFFQKHLKNEFNKFEERSKYEWQLDLEKLKDFND